MKKTILILFLAVLFPFVMMARAVRFYNMKTLIAKSQLVFVGRVNAIAPTGLQTTMSYPTWKDVTFEWLMADVEVLEPIKGVNKGDHVVTAMLSAPEGKPMANSPGMIDPKMDTIYLLCLLPTTMSNVFAALTAPWDDDQSIFILDRHDWKYGSYRDDKNAYADDVWNDHRERFAVIWSLVDEDGHIMPAGTEQMRKKYKTEINTSTASNTVIYLQWETFKSPSGWQWDVPKGDGNATNSTGRAPIPAGPVTIPGR